MSHIPLVLPCTLDSCLSRKCISSISFAASYNQCSDALEGAVVHICYWPSIHIATITEMVYNKHSLSNACFESVLQTHFILCLPSFLSFLTYLSEYGNVSCLIIQERRLSLANQRSLLEPSQDREAPRDSSDLLARVKQWK